MIELLVLQLFFPPVLGYLATTKGYKFWPWALIGFFVPVISIFILFAMKSKPIVIDPSKIIVQENIGTIIYQAPKKENKI